MRRVRGGLITMVRPALMAVYTLLEIKKEIPPVFKGQHDDIGVLFNALKTMHR